LLLLVPGFPAVVNHSLGYQLVSLSEALLQHVPGCSLLDANEILYVKHLSHNRKKKECSGSKLSDITGERRILSFIHFHLQYLRE
jgi:hypothetical protein